MWRWTNVSLNCPFVVLYKPKKRFYIKKYININNLYILDFRFTNMYIAYIFEYQ